MPFSHEVGGDILSLLQTFMKTFFPESSTVLTTNLHNRSRVIPQAHTRALCQQWRGGINCRTQEAERLPGCSGPQVSLSERPAVILICHRTTPANCMPELTRWCADGTQASEAQPLALAEHQLELSLVIAHTIVAAVQRRRH